MVFSISRRQATSADDDLWSPATVRAFLRLFLTAAILVLLAAPSGAAPPLSLSTAERAWLSAHPVIRIGVDPAYAPYSFVNAQGQADGVAAEITALIGERLGLRFELVPKLSWSQVLEGARQREVDLILAVAHRPEREAYLNFSHIYLSTPLVVMTRTDAPRLGDLAQLNRLRVALTKDHASTAQAMRRYRRMQVIQVATPLEGMRAVSEGRAEAFIGELGVNTLLASRSGITNVTVNTGFDMNNGQRYGVRKDWPELAPLLGKALDSIPQAEINRILARWIPVFSAEIRPAATALDVADRAEIATLPELRVGVVRSLSPFDFINANGHHQGLGADTLALLVKRTGIKTRVVSVASMEQLLHLLSKGEVDLALGVNGGSPGAPHVRAD